MTADKRTFVSFQPRDGEFMAFLAMEEVFSGDNDPEVVLGKAAEVYGNWIGRMRSLIAEIENLRGKRKLVPARKMWELGNAIFGLVQDLEKLCLQLDGTYDHLVRDLGVKRKWLEKVIIFRRYLPDRNAIPESLNWGRCEKGTRRVAEKLRDGVSPG